MTDPREEVLQRFLDEWHDGEFLVPEIIAHIYDAGKKAQREEDAQKCMDLAQRL